MKRFLWKLYMHFLPAHSRMRRMIKTRILKFQTNHNQWMFDCEPYHCYEAKLCADISESRCICVGSSHTEFGVNPHVMRTPTWNLAVNSGDLYTAYWLIANKISGGGTIVALGYDFWMQGARLEESPFVGISVLCHLFANVPLRSQFALALWLRKARCGFTEKNSSPMKDARGYFYREGNINMNDALIRATAHMKTVAHQPTEWIWLKKLQLLCEKRNARLVVFFPPSRADYRAHLPSKQMLFGSFLNHFPEIPLLDCFDDPDFVFEDFADADHLNLRGAEKFSHKLDDFILNFRK